jgi:hypothetical protein
MKHFYFSFYVRMVLKKNILLNIMTLNHYCNCFDFYKRIHLKLNTAKPF